MAKRHLPILALTCDLTNTPLLLPATLGKNFRNLLVVLALLVGVSVPAEADLRFTDYQVKAVFLYNLTHFVSWPLLQSDDNPAFLIGIVGNDPFESIIDHAIDGERYEKRSIKIRRYENAADLDNQPPNILFVSADMQREFQQLKQTLKGFPVLTVSDYPGFVEQGGMVNLLTKQQKIELEINHSEARKAGLSISSKLLSLAKKVL